MLNEEYIIRKTRVAGRAEYEALLCFHRKLNLSRGLVRD